MNYKPQNIILILSFCLLLIGLGWYLFSKSGNDQNMKTDHLDLSEDESEKDIPGELAETDSLGGDAGLDLENVRDPFQKDFLRKGSLEKDGITKNITYDDLCQLSPNQQLASDLLKVFPPFILKGVVSQIDNLKALLILDSHTYILGLGDQVADWVVIEISDRAVKLSNHHSQSFVLTLEGMMIDDQAY